MVQLDWKRVLSLSPEDLSEQDKDDFYESLVWYEPEANIEPDNMKVLFQLTREILKHKGEQVESLLTELDEMATRQGEEEAHRQRALIEENEELKMQLAERRRAGSQAGALDASDSQQQIMKLEIQKEQLSNELHAREEELLQERNELEKLSAQVASLEREKGEIQRELSALQSESIDQRQALLQQQESWEIEAQHQKELAEVTRQKNQQISQLLTEVEEVEKENSSLREKLASVRDELSDATRLISQMTGEYTGLKQSCLENDEKMSQLQEENVALRSQVDDLVQQKMFRDHQLDDFSEAVDARIETWKKLMDQKDAEIEELQARLSHLEAQAPNIEIDTERSHVALLTKTLQDREEQIENLQKQLSQAAKELNESAGVFEQMKSQSVKQPVSAEVDADTLRKLKIDLQQAESRVTLLENKLHDAETDAQTKAEEMTEMVIQLREYESGDYGLAEAVGEIKELRRQLRVRDRQIEELVQESNELQSQTGQLEDENIALRERLGIPPGESVSVNGVSALRKREQSLLQVLQQEAEHLEEDKVQLKLENRKLKQQVNKLIRQMQRVGLQPSVDSVDVADFSSGRCSKVSDTARRQLNFDAINIHGDEKFPSLEIERLSAENEQLNCVNKDLETRLQDTIEENDCLRKGLHEILESVHLQDASSSVSLESPVLEKLLQALDSRHISGWYHPAMRLQAQLQAMEGTNTALREQLRGSRQEESTKSLEVQKAQMKIEKLESIIALWKEKRSSGMDMVQDLSLPSNLPFSSAEVIAKLNKHLLTVLNEYHKEEEKSKKLEENLDMLHKKLNILRHQIGLIYKQHKSEKGDWTKEKLQLEAEKNKLSDSVAGATVKIQEYEDHLEAVEKTEDEQKQFVVKSARKMAILKANEVQLVRKCDYLKNRQNQLEKENAKLQDEMASMECSVVQKIGDLQRHKEMANYRISALQHLVEESVPLQMLEAANRQYAELTSKYRDLLQKEHSLVSQSQLAARLQEEEAILRKDKEELQKELHETKEKLHSLEVIVSSLGEDRVTQESHDNQISALSKQLATQELKELSERQRADHADKMYQILRDQVKQLEERNTELESQCKGVVKQNLELQHIERELRDQLLTFVSKENFEEIQSRLQTVETQKNELQLENEKLREMGDIGQEQVRALELRKFSKESELESLKRQVLDLQAFSDEKSTIARLHNDLLRVQMNEVTVHKKVQKLQGQISKLQSQNIRQEQKLDEKEKLIANLKNQLNIRCRSLHEVIQDLRRQYSGAVPLTTQEKLSLSLITVNEEKLEVSQKLKEAEKAAWEAELQKEELATRIQSLEELQSRLKSETGSKQIIDWHNKNEELRLQELKSRRQAGYLERQVKHLEETMRRQEAYIDKLEEEKIHLEKEWEHRQIVWEQREVELQKQLTDETEKQKSPKDEMKHLYQRQMSEEKLPESEQLKQALELVSSNSQKLIQYEAELSQLKGRVSALSEQLEEKERSLQAKERVLSELRIQIPTTVERLIREKESAEDLESKLALKGTIQSLKDIIGQKEDTISRYQLMLKEERDEHSKAAFKFQEEIRELHYSLNNQQDAYNRLRNNFQYPSADVASTGSLISQHLTQIHELEDEVAHLNASIGNLSNQLQSCHVEAERGRVAEDRLRQVKEQLQRHEEQHQSDQELLERYRQEVNDLKSENYNLKDELRQQVSTSTMSPSAGLKKLIQKLRKQLEEKEKKEVALNELKGQMNQFAEEVAEEIIAERMPAARDEEASTKKVELLEEELQETRIENLSLKKQVRNSRKREKKYADENTTQKEDLTNALDRNRVLKDENEHLAREIKRLNEQKFQKKSQSEVLLTAEKEDLRHKVKLLEEKLEAANKLSSSTAEEDTRKLKSAEELARWDERKRWQQSADRLKEKLKEKTASLEKVEQNNKSLRDTITRLEREKNFLQAKLKSSKGAETYQTRAEELEINKVKLENEILDLKNQLERLRQKDIAPDVAHRHVQLLQERIETQQRQITALELAKKGNPAVAQEVEKLQESVSLLQKQNLHLESSNLELKLELEKLRTDTPRLKEHVEHLENYVSLLRAEQSEDRVRIAPSSSSSSEEKPVKSTSKKSTAELEKTIIVMKRIIERLQLENKKIKGSKKSGAHERKSSPDRLRNELKLLQEEKRSLQDHYVDALNRVSELEKELQNSNRQCKLLEEKLHLLVKSDRKPTSDEMAALKAQLARKSNLLADVKQLLQRAAIRERELQAQVLSLQGKETRSNCTTVET